MMTVIALLRFISLLFQQATSGQHHTTVLLSVRVISVCLLVLFRFFSFLVFFSFLFYLCFCHLPAVILNVCVPHAHFIISHMLHQ